MNSRPCASQADIYATELIPGLQSYLSSMTDPEYTGLEGLGIMNFINTFDSK